MKRICAWCNEDLPSSDTDPADETVLEISHGMCETCAAKAESEGKRLTAAVPRRITLADLTVKMREYNRSAAPGSECNAWQDYIADAVELCGCAPWDCDYEDANVPRDFGWYWLSVAEGKSGEYEAATGAHVRF